MTGVFSSVLKTAKVVPVFKKDLKLDYSNYRPISLLSNIEKLMYKIRFSITTILSKLSLDNNILHRMP